MRQVEYGPDSGPDSMRVVEAARPTPAGGEILIEVHFAGVNGPDLAQRQGRYPPPPGASKVLGLEVAGRVVELGAGAAQWHIGEMVTDYRQEDFVARIKQATDGVDVVLDMVGGAYLQKDVSVLKQDGRLVMIAFLQGSKVEFDFMPVMRKRLTVTGSTM